MTRSVFYSFHYAADCWRAAQVRNIGVVEGNQSAHDNDWEAITRGGAQAIQRWIDNQLVGKSCTIVLIGQNTAGRKWINYEIEKSWNSGKGLLGIYIHNLLDVNKNKSSKGSNPFDDCTPAYLSQIVRVYDPPFWLSSEVYNYISSNLASWVEEAIRIRSRY